MKLHERLKAQGSRLRFQVSSLPNFRLQTSDLRLGAVIVFSAALVVAPVVAQSQVERRAPDTLHLTLAEAVERAVEHNPDLAIVRLATEVETARVGESRGAFAPVFSSTLGRSGNVTPPSSVFSGGQGVDVQDWFSSTGVRQRLPWG